MTRSVPFLVFALTTNLLCSDDSSRVLRIDHYVPVKSTAPGMDGQTGHIYVREVAKAGGVMRGATPPDRVVLFIHGAGTPGHVAFDAAPSEGYSWMEYLANAGFDVFSMDMTGYGKSSRPAAMNDPCNLSGEQQQQFGTKCASTSTKGPITTWASDWNDISAVVDHIRALRRVERLNLIGWSLGGPRTMGYTAEHMDKVRSVVLLAPAYSRKAGREFSQAQFNTQSRSEFDANWDRQLGCPAQFEPAVRDAVWNAMLQSDPIGATWGSGVRRAPNTGPSGSLPDVVKKATTPLLIVSAVHDVQAPAARLRELFQDSGATQKVFLDLGCASHNIPWEKNRLHLFQASVDWFTKGEVNGAKQGETKLGY